MDARLSTARYFYLTDRFGELLRVDPLTGLCHFWFPRLVQWRRAVTYHNVSESARPLSPFYGPLPKHYYSEA